MEDDASFGEEVVNYAYAYYGNFLFLWGKQKNKRQCPDRLAFAQCNTIVYRSVLLSCHRNENRSESTFCRDKFILNTIKVSYYYVIFFT